MFLYGSPYLLLALETHESYFLQYYQVINLLKISTAILNWYIVLHLSNWKAEAGVLPCLRLTFATQ